MTTISILTQLMSLIKRKDNTIDVPLFKPRTVKSKAGPATVVSPVEPILKPVCSVPQKEVLSYAVKWLFVELFVIAIWQDEANRYIACM